MITDEINVLREKLEKQILNNESYDIIYKTSASIDALLTKYYRDKKLSEGS